MVFKNLTDLDERDSCFEEFANNFQQVLPLQEILSICEKISVQNRKDACYSVIATNNEDINICNKIITKNSREDCYSHIAYKKNDSSICDNITIQEKRDNCYSDLLICNKIEDKNIRNICYFYLAIKNKDLTLCNEINGKSEIKQEVLIMYVTKDTCNKCVASNNSVGCWQL